MTDLERMQRQAAQRVQQMQEHSRRVLEQHQEASSMEIATRRWPGDAPDRLASPGLYTRPKPPEEPPSAEEHTGECLTEADAEQWFLLGLALLLFRSGCRPELAIALLYLAMG